jgi:hypothetical protein
MSVKGRLGSLQETLQNKKRRTPVQKEPQLRDQLHIETLERIGSYMARKVAGEREERL